MSERRKPRGLVTPAYEDRGIFKNEIISMPVWLVPSLGRTQRRDIVISGHYRTEKDGLLPIEVIFAGRRIQYAYPLISLLQKKLGKSPPPGSPGIPVHVNGAWRYRFDVHRDGWQDRVRQFMVAQWSQGNTEGEAGIIGEPPIRQPVPRPKPRPRQSVANTQR